MKEFPATHHQTKCLQKALVDNAELIDPSMDNQSAALRFCRTRMSDARMITALVAERSESQVRAMATYLLSVRLADQNWCGEEFPRSRLALLHKFNGRTERSPMAGGFLSMPSARQWF